MRFSLNLRHNYLESAGAEALIELGAHVDRLNLAWNQIGESGGRAIAESFVVAPATLARELFYF